MIATTSTDLTRLWVETLADGLVRADQIVGIKCHPTPPVAGKPSHWLFDVIVRAVSGGGTSDHGSDGWLVTPLHRTLAQTTQEPRDAPVILAWLLSQLGPATGVISVNTHALTEQENKARSALPLAHEAMQTIATGLLNFRFTPFAPIESRVRIGIDDS